MLRGVQMRINLSLNENNSKDKKIIDFLESRYNASAYIKEVLYQLASGGFHGVGATVNVIDNGRGIPAGIHPDIEELDNEETFDEIIGFDNIDI